MCMYLKIILHMFCVGVLAFLDVNKRHLWVSWGTLLLYLIFIFVGILSGNPLIALWHQIRVCLFLWVSWRTFSFFANTAILPQRSTYAQLGWCSYVRAYVRTCVRTSRWKILFTPYLVVELSPSAENWCVYVTSINDGTQTLTFLGIDNIRDFQNSRIFCGNYNILNPELHWFIFSDRLQLLHSFPELCTHS